MTQSKVAKEEDVADVGRDIYILPFIREETDLLCRARRRLMAQHMRKDKAARLWAGISGIEASKHRCFAGS